MNEKERQAEQEVLENSEKFKGDFDEDRLFKKIAKFAKEAGVKLVFIALLLFYALKSKNMPITAKATVMGALGYFILPMDIIPDFIPVAGYSDDLAALLAVLKTVSMYVDEPVKIEAKSVITRWFDVSEDELDKICNTLF